MKKAWLVSLLGRQVVLLPSDCVFDDSEVFVYRDRRTLNVILSSRPRSWAEFFEATGRYDVPDDFMSDRQQGVSRRDPFEDWDLPEVSERKLGPSSADGDQAVPHARPDAAALERYILTAQFDRLRRAVMARDMTLDDAVREILRNVF